ncbi:MAG: hypothetical protein SOY69_03755, partial [Alloprevotella sp.]|nr:hypothetical protein [Alloprevotella sp.]
LAVLEFLAGLAVLDFLDFLDFLEQLELIELIEEPALAAATRRPRITLYIDRGRRGREKRMWG